MKREFEKWLFEVASHIASKKNGNVHEIYLSIDLTEARLQFIDGVLPQNYK